MRKSREKARGERKIRIKKIHEMFSEKEFHLKGIYDKLNVYQL